MKIEQHLLIFIFGPFLPQERLNFLQQRIKCSLDLDHCPFDNEKYRSQVECPICTRLRLLLLLQLPNLHRLGRFEVCNSNLEFSPQSAHHLANVPSSVYGVLAHIPKRYEKKSLPSMLGCFASLWRQILLSCYKGKGSKKPMCPVRGRMHEVSMPFEKSCADANEKGALYQAIALHHSVRSTPEFSRQERLCGPRQSLCLAGVVSRDVYMES